MQTDREYINDRIDSDFAFNQVIKPVIDDYYGWSFSLHNNDKEDKYHHIDGYVKMPFDSIPFANRVQPQKDWRSFTIRFKKSNIDNDEWIEYGSIKSLLNKKLKYPMLALQSYVKKTSDKEYKFISSAKIATRDLWDYLDNNWDKLKTIETTDKYVTAFAKVVWWDDIKHIKSFNIIES